MAPIRHQCILVGIETDPTRYHGEHARRPALLDRVAAEQVLAHIAADLTALIPGVSRCALTMAGALFDQTQILTPQLPVYKALEALQASTYNSDFQARLLSVGASNGQMPDKALQPNEQTPLGLLQVLPLLASGQAQDVESLAEEMEHRFLEQGQLSAHSAKGLESHFQVSVNHARFMTMTDLNALLRLQLEHYGFLPLWELIDVATNAFTQSLQVRTAKGLTFKWRDGAVHSFFETFDWWAKYGCGADIPDEKHQMQLAYIDRTREYRRYLTMLTAHGIKVSQHLPGLEDAELPDSFLLEESTRKPDQFAAQVTHHNADDLGVVAITVACGNRQMNFFPLQPNGLDDIQRFIHKQGWDGDTAFSDGLCFDQNTRQLAADTLPEAPPREL